MIHFWAKTTPEGKPGISVCEHMLDVGHVAKSLAELSPGLLEQFHLRSAEVGALAALHDIGKISPGFQRKCQEWLDKNEIADIARNGCWDTATESDHGKVSHAAIQSFLMEQGISRETGKFLSAILGAHHGRLNPPNDRGYRAPKAICESHSGIDWDTERRECAQIIWEFFNADSSFIELNDESSALWWLAGLTTVADWLGSNERFFSPVFDVSEKDRPAISRTALNAVGFRQNQFVSNLSFHDLFHDINNPEIKWVPNEMQEKTLITVNEPGVYVIEAPMGMGKTEAALWAAYQLLVSGKANGIYFALPTQATSNRIHLRVEEFLRRIAPKVLPSRLVHGNSWLLAPDCGICSAVTDAKGTTTDDARAGRDWFASTKRALLAPFGVGTIDQALLGVVAAKHFFVRQFALAGKVVILDEIHSYDLYTGTLIDELITTLDGLGCTVMVLSATLTGKRREQIVPRTDDVSSDTELPCPLITGRKEGIAFEPVAATPPEARNIKVDFIDAEKAIEDAIKLAQNGGTVLWICNTVDVAQQQYRRFMEQTQGEYPIGLLHSRFPFWRREELETEWMERLGKNGKMRCGSILVSTQVVEQSVDLDADLMITELAPTDMLLQRLGRLWRHERGQRPVDEARLCIIDEARSLEDFRTLSPHEIKKDLGSKAHVYAPFVLLRTLEVWGVLERVSIPSQIRKLIESTYKERENEPDSWQQLLNEWFGTDSAKKMIASRNCNLWQVALEDAEGVQTRLNELPTVPLILCQSLSDHEAVFIDHSRGPLYSDQYRLATAQAIHKNLVRVPRYCFDYIESCPDFTYKKTNNLKSINRLDHVAHYIYGEQSIGIVAKSGAVEVKGLKNGTGLYYSDKMGLFIEKISTREEI